jgi:hypothetical protein
MAKAAAKSWLKIYRVIDCIDVLFTPNAMVLATTILTSFPGARQGVSETIISAQSSSARPGMVVESPGLWNY